MLMYNEPPIAPVNEHAPILEDVAPFYKQKLFFPIVLLVLIASGTGIFLIYRSSAMSSPLAKGSRSGSARGDEKTLIAARRSSPEKYTMLERFGLGATGDGTQTGSSTLGGDDMPIGWYFNWYGHTSPSFALPDTLPAKNGLSKIMHKVDYLALAFYSGSPTSTTGDLNDAACKPIVEAVRANRKNFPHAMQWTVGNELGMDVRIGPVEEARRFINTYRCLKNIDPSFKVGTGAIDIVNILPFTLRDYDIALRDAKNADGTKKYTGDFTSAPVAHCALETAGNFDLPLTGMTERTHPALVKRIGAADVVDYNVAGEAGVTLYYPRITYVKDGTTVTLPATTQVRYAGKHYFSVYLKTIIAAGITPDFVTAHAYGCNFENVAETRINIPMVRKVMFDRGLRNQDLIVNEVGPLGIRRLLTTVDAAAVNNVYGKAMTFMDGVLPYMVTLRDTAHGNPDDNYRMVQKVAWFMASPHNEPFMSAASGKSDSDGFYFGLNIFTIDFTQNPPKFSLSPLGEKYKTYINSLIAIQKPSTCVIQGTTDTALTNAEVRVEDVANMGSAVKKVTRETRRINGNTAYTMTVPGNRTYRLTLADAVSTASYAGAAVKSTTCTGVTACPAVANLQAGVTRDLLCPSGKIVNVEWKKEVQTTTDPNFSLTAFATIDPPTCQSNVGKYMLRTPIRVRNSLSSSKGLAESNIFIAKECGSLLCEYTTASPAPWCASVDGIMQYSNGKGSFCSIKKSVYTGTSTTRQSMEASWTPRYPGIFYVVVNAKSALATAPSCSGNPRCEYSKSTLTKYGPTSCTSWKIRSCQEGSDVFKGKVSDPAQGEFSGEAIRFEVPSSCVSAVTPTLTPTRAPTSVATITCARCTTTNNFLCTDTLGTPSCRSSQTVPALTTSGWTCANCFPLTVTPTRTPTPRP